MKNPISQIVRTLCGQFDSLELKIFHTVCGKCLRAYFHYLFIRQICGFFNEFYVHPHCL